jgi:hypothetical protein
VLHRVRRRCSSRCRVCRGHATDAVERALCVPCAADVHRCAPLCQCGAPGRGMHHDVIAYGAFARLRIYRPQGPIRYVVVLLSGDGGARRSAGCDRVRGSPCAARWPQDRRTRVARGPQPLGFALHQGGCHACRPFGGVRLRPGGVMPCPGLALHGLEDRECPVLEGREFVQGVPGRRFVALPGWGTRTVMPAAGGEPSCPLLTPWQPPRRRPPRRPVASGGRLI